MEDLRELDYQKKPLSFEATRVEVDMETGEVSRIVKDTNVQVDREPDYIKVYIDTMLAFRGCDPSLTPYLIAYCRYMTYANNNDPLKRCIIQTNGFVRAAVADAVNVTERAVTKATKKLIDANIFIPIFREDKAGKRRQVRGVYFVNPWVIARGDWSSIKNLRAEFQFVSGAASGVIETAEGKRKYILPPIREMDNGQLSLDMPEREEDR